MECEVMCNTGSITWSLHDCTCSTKAFIIPRAAYKLGNVSVHCNWPAPAGYHAINQTI